MVSVCRFVICLLAVNGLSSAVAQGFRVEGHVYRIDQALEAGRLDETRISSSVTLFHNGRVYDYVEAADEVIIFEPTARRFTILNTARELVTTADFDEIHHMMDARRTESKRYLQELNRLTEPDTDRITSSLQFQLDPEFDTQFNSDSGLLTMTSTSWKYRVQTHTWPDADQVKEYLLYADWISQLNYVLHPSSRFPEPRVLLNRQLRELNRIPTSVMRDLYPHERLKLRAEHKFIADLTPNDRHLVQVWDSAARGSSVRRLSLRGYQETVLLSQR